MEKENFWHRLWQDAKKSDALTTEMAAVVVVGVVVMLVIGLVRLLISQVHSLVSRTRSFERKKFLFCGC